MKIKEKLTTVSLFLIGISLPMSVYSKGLLFIIAGVGAILGMACLNFEEIKQSLIKIKNSRVAFLLLLVLVTLFISVLFSINREYSIHKMIGILITYLFLILNFIVLDNTKKENFSIIFKSMAVIFCLDLLYLYYVMLVVSDTVKDVGWIRISAIQLAVIFPLIFGWLYNTVKYKQLAWGLLGITVTTVFATGGRSAMLSLVWAIMLILLLLVWQKKEELKLKTIFILLSSLILSVFLGLQTYKIFDKRFDKNDFERRLTLKSKDLSSGRFEIWQASIKEGLKNPIIGTGIGSFKTVLKDKILSRKEVVYHPHNFLIEVFVSTGLLGVIVFSCFVFYTCFDLLLKVISKNVIAIFSLASYTSYWVASFTNISILQLEWLIFLSISTLIGHFYIKKG